MSVRKTETRIPQGLQPSDLGEAVTSADGRCSLVSFLSSPLTAGRENIYVLFITDATLSSSIKSYEWFIDEDGDFPKTVVTEVGELKYQLTNAGNIAVTVHFKDAASSELGKVRIVQEIGSPNPSLEQLISDAVDKSGPSASNVEVVRELVNGYYAYYQTLSLKVPESDNSFIRFICTFLFEGVLKNKPEDREILIDQLVAALENNEQFVTAATVGVGVCGIRLSLLAMNFPAPSPFLAWSEIPETTDKNAFADEQVRQKLANLSEENKIDLINIARFPKTNVKQCAKIIEALRDKYFPGTSFNDVLTGMSGTREHWIVKHYSKGPLAT